ncbi:MAG TPA: ORF6N domain-containing protein [Spirochaetota bacterium]|nr:ORF6N domain-containing protein [Spirochaetota bacterium]
MNDTAIEHRILVIRGLRVMLDADLAELYNVPTKRLNEQVKRNMVRFPSDFVFRLTAAEKVEVVANCDHLAGLKFSKTLPHAFTEHGAIMAACVLNSPRAVEMSVFIVRAFIKLRETLSTSRALAGKLAELEEKVGSHNGKIQAIISTIRMLMGEKDASPRRKIGFK